MTVGLVTSMKDWEYSSYPDFAGLRNGTLCNLELAEELIGFSKANFLNESEEMIRQEEIRWLDEGL